MPYDLNEEPKGEQYRALINYLCDHSDAAMLVSHTEWCETKSDKQQIKKNRKTLAPYRVGTRSNPKWTVTTKFYTQPTDIQYYIDFYKICEPVRQYILTTVDRLYEWELPKTPEDISFFLKGTCIFASCTHEEFAWIVCEKEFIKSLGIQYTSISEDDFRDPIIESYQFDGGVEG
jgi:hypothetical protein